MELEYPKFREHNCTVYGHSFERIGCYFVCIYCGFNVLINANKLKEVFER